MIDHNIAMILAPLMQPIQRLIAAMGPGTTTQIRADSRPGRKTFELHINDTFVIDAVITPDAITLSGFDMDERAFPRGSAHEAAVAITRIVANFADYLEDTADGEA